VASGQDIVSLARAQIGDPYILGATGPASFDCSGLVEWVYNQFGLRTPRTTTQMMAQGSPLVPIDRAHAQAGDLVFSNWIGRPSSHVAILTGKGTVIEAPEPGKTVRETTLGPTYLAHVDAYRRVPGLSDAPAQPSGALTGVVAGINAVFPGVGTVVGIGVHQTTGGPVGDAINTLSGAAVGMVEGVQEMGRLATLLAHLFMPGAILRGAIFFLGWILIIIGIWFLSLEVRDV
jgi:NlpC/P60 family